PLELVERQPLVHRQGADDPEPQSLVDDAIEIRQTRIAVGPDLGEARLAERAAAVVSHRLLGASPSHRTSARSSRPSRSGPRRTRARAARLHTPEARTAPPRRAP